MSSKRRVDGVKALVDSLELRFNFAESRVDGGDDKPNQRGVKQHRNAHCDVELFVGYQRNGARPSLILSQNW